MENQFQPNGSPAMPPQQPQKKRRVWLWITVGIFALFILTDIFSDEDKGDKTEETAGELPTLSRESWTDNLVTDLTIQNEYIDSVIPRAKSTKSMEMLGCYFRDMKKIANKVITDSLYMDVYETPEIAKAMDENSKKATKILPELGKICRTKYADELGNRLWEENIYVELSKDTKTITFIGAVFASNKHIKEWQENIGDGLREMGFTQSRYKWIKHASEYTYYDL